MSKKRACYDCQYYKPQFIGGHGKNICLQSRYKGNATVGDFPSYCEDYKQDERMAKIIKLANKRRRLDKEQEQLARLKKRFGGK